MPIHKKRILFEDDYLLAVNKLPHELVVAGKGKSDKLPLLDFLKKQYPSIKPVHRLDYETSGVVLFVKDPDILAAMIEDKFANMTKKYVALVKGRLDKKHDTITKPLPARTKGVVEAQTEYVVLDLYANSSLVECTIATGRHHQIRKHMAYIHHPLVQDYEYGNKKFNDIFYREFRYRNFFLHASSLDLVHPITGEQLHITAPLPLHFAKLVKFLGAK